MHAEFQLTAKIDTDIVCSGANSSCLEGRCVNMRNNLFNSVAGNREQVEITHRTTVFGNEGLRWEGHCKIDMLNAGMGVHDLCLPTVSCLVQDPVGCRLASHGEAPKGECGTETTWRASNPLLSLADLNTQQPYTDPATPDCSTLENRTVDNSRLDLAVARSSASNGFWSTLPAPSDQEDAARHELIKQAKLMYELGITSASVPANTLRALYASAPADEATCGVSAATPVTISESCRAFGTDNSLVGPLGLCQRMLSTHVVASVFQAELDSCLDLLTRPELAGTSACAGEYRGLVETLAERLLTKAGLSAIQKPNATSPIQGLGTSLSRLDRWYAGAAVAFANDAPGLADAVGRVLKDFWARVYAIGAAPPTFALGEAGSETARAQLAQLFGERIEADRQVLDAAYANPAPLDELPLLLITGDALVELSQQLRTAAPLYDVACRVKGSCSIAEANEATLLLRIIGAIGNDTELEAALNAGANGAVRPAWHQVFTSLRARRAALQDAYRKATGRPTATLDELYGGNVIAPAAALAELVTTSRAMWTSYATHGVLLPRDSSVIRTNLADAKVVTTLQSFLESRNNLMTQRTDYQRTRGDFAKTILDRIANQQFQNRIDADALLLRTEYDNLARDLDGLMAAQDQAEQLIGRFLATYSERARNPQWFPDFPISGDPAVLTIDATAARGTGSVASSAADVAVRDPASPTQPWQLTVAKGDMLTFDVSGGWSPTCALRRTQLAGPNGTRTFADPTHVVTGPEGFSISFENGQFRAREHTSSDFSSQTDTQSVCGSISTNPLTVVDGPNSAVPLGGLSASASACRQWQTGHSDTDSNSNGARFTFNAGFAGGLRVPGTPFPTFPGGALLLVEVINAPNGPQMREAHVVRPHSSFVFRDAATVYLIANDQIGCGSIDITHALTINYVKGQSASVAAQNLARTMGSILASLRTQRDLYVAQGSVSATELTQLQNSAQDQLRAACNCNLSAFPDEVRGMFDAWLSSELAAIERATRIVAASRALDSLTLRLRALEGDLAGAQNASRLLSLLTIWELAHLAYPQLRGYADLLLELSNDEILPIMRILYPQALATLRATQMAQVEAVRTLDWTLPYDEQVFRLEALADAMKARVDQARNAGGQAVAPVAVVFPKPVEPGATQITIPGTVNAAPERLLGVWEPCTAGFCLKRHPVFTIAPEDIYGHPLTGLSCQEAAPVVQAFAIIAVNGGISANDDWNTNPRRADIFRNADVKFPTEEGVLGYHLQGALAPARVRVLASAATDVASSFGTFVRPGGEFQGVSAFNSFAIELGAVVTDSAFPLSSAKAIVVYFDALTRTAAGPLAGLGVCTQPVGPLTSPPAGGGDGPSDGPPAGGGGAGSNLVGPTMTAQAVSPAVQSSLPAAPLGGAQ
jgi:hypothetical protein